MKRTAARICDKCGKEGGRKRGKNTLCNRCLPKKLKAVHDVPDYAAFVREAGCVVAGMQGKHDGKSWLHECSGYVQAHHVRSRGAGGKDDGNLVGLCERAHAQLHQMGAKSFPDAYGVNLFEIAARFGDAHTQEKEGHTRGP